MTDPMASSRSRSVPRIITGQLLPFVSQIQRDPTFTILSPHDINLRSISYTFALTHHGAQTSRLYCESLVEQVAVRNAKSQTASAGF